MMGNWLARLKSEKAPDSHAREPRQPPELLGGAGFLGFLAYPPAPFGKIDRGDKPAEPANDEAPATDPDRWCWPNSPAMNRAEIDTFTARLARFTDKGLAHTHGEALADKLLIRDRESDDRHVCLECRHLAGRATGSWRCGNWQRAGVARHAGEAGLAADLVQLLQRCSGFTRAIPSPFTGDPHGQA